MARHIGEETFANDVIPRELFSAFSCSDGLELHLKEAPKNDDEKPQTMNQKANRNSGVEQELTSLESQWQEALTRRDVAMLDRLMADDYTLITVSGEVVNKARVLAEVKSVNATADVRNTEVAVRVYGDVAIVTGLALISGKFNDKDVSTRSRYIKVYVKRQGQWRVVAAQATLIAQQ